MKGNWYFSVKARRCADIQKHQEVLNKSYVTSPTLSLEVIPVTSCINAAGQRNIWVVAIPGAFLASDMDEIVHMMLRGRLVELMAQVNPSVYWKYVRVEILQKLLYVQLHKAL